MDAKREMVKSNFAMCKSACEILKSNHEIRIFDISWVYAVIDRMMVTVSTSQREPLMGWAEWRDGLLSWLTLAAAMPWRPH